MAKQTQWIRGVAAPALLALAMAVSARAQVLAPAAEQPGLPGLVVQSKVDRVLLYSDRALVMRAAKLALPAGRLRVVFEGLPGKLFDESVAAALNAAPNTGIKIANIEVEPVFKTTFRTEEAQKAAEELKDLERQMRVLQENRAVVVGEMDFARNIRIGARPPTTGEAKPIPLAPEAWAAVLDYMGDSFRQAAQAERKLAEDMDLMRARVVVAAAKARLLLSYKNELTKRVTLEVVADRPGECAFELSYMLRDAAWFPRYDVRADLAAGKIEIIGYGLVRQETGEDWTDAQLAFSAAEPSMAATLPQLTSWRIVAGEPVMAERSSLFTVVTFDQEHNAPIRKLLETEKREGGKGTLAPMTPPSAAKPRSSVSGDSVQVLRDNARAGELKQSLERIESQSAAVNVSGKAVAQPGAQLGLNYSNRVEQQVKEIEKLNYFQAQAREKNDWKSFNDYNGKIIDRISQMDQGQQYQFTGLNTAAVKNIDMFQRWEQSEKLAGGLIAPVRSSGGYDYRWKALRRESVPSDGVLTRTVLFRTEFPATFVYEVAAEKSKLAFLRTKLKNSSRSPFLAGPASVFLGTDFVGESAVATCVPAEDFTIGLGADEQIAIERRVESKRDTRGILSSNYRFNVDVSITVRNNKNRPVTVAILERVPYSWTPDKLEVSEPKFTPALADTAHLGKWITLARWEADLAPGAKHGVSLSYWYQHPADMRATLADDPSVKW